MSRLPLRLFPMSRLALRLFSWARVRPNTTIPPSTNMESEAPDCCMPSGGLAPDPSPSPITTNPPEGPSEGR